MEEYRTNVYLGYKSIFDETLCLLLFEKKEDTITIDRGQKEPTPPLAIGYGVCKGGFHAARATLPCLQLPGPLLPVLPLPTDDDDQGS